MPKKFLDQNGLEYFARKFNDYPDNEILGTVITAIGEELDGKSDVGHTHSQYQTASDVNGAITQALGNITEFSISVLSALPNTGEQGVFYFIPNNGSGNNIYDEYVWVNNSFEKIGSTAVDLSNYLQKTDIADWAKSAQKPTYTAAEVGALPSTYTAPVTSVNGQTGAVTLTIPAAQVQSDWNATSGMGVILNKPTIPAATTVTNTLASGTLIATINGTNIYAPAYVDADGVSY